MSKKCQFEDVTMYSHAQQVIPSCLIPFYGIPTFHTFIIRRFLYSRAHAPALEFIFTTRVLLMRNEVDWTRKRAKDLGGPTDRDLGTDPLDRSPGVA